MLNHPKSTLYSLIITAFLFILLAGCNLNHQGKRDAVIEIDLTQQGKALNANMYGAFIKAKIPQSAIQSQTKITAVKPGTGDLHAALTEAALLIGMENNAANVKITSADIQAFKTPSDYAISLFAENRPDKVVPTKVTMTDIDKQPQPLIFATAGLQEKAGFVIIKVVNSFNSPKVCRIILKYKQQIKYKGEAYVMTSGNILDENSVKEPEKVVPMTKELKGLKNTFNYECPANSIVVIKLRYKKRTAGLGNCC